MSISPVFKNLFVASTIEQNLLTVLNTWFPTYLHEIERQLGLAPDSIPAPVHYSNRNSFDATPGEQLPRVVVIAPGLVGSPLQTGGGQYRATWRVGVGVATSAATEVRANLLSKIYGAAVRGIVLQNAGTLGIVEWVDESYEDIPIEGQIQQYRATAVWFTIDIENVVTKWGGPEVPDLPPTEYSYGQVQDVIIEIDYEEV